VTGEPAGPDPLEAAAAAVRGARQVALACHVNPDGDALGSMLALLHVLRAAGRDVVASFPTPFRVAPHYRDLPGLDLLVSPAEFPTEPDVMITLARLGDLEPAAKGARALVVVDHHVSNERFGTVNLVDPDAAASGVVVQALVDRLGLPLDRDAAVCLYAALVCDTGRFQYASTTPAVFDLARRLTEFDVPVPELSRRLFEEHRFAYLQLLGDALARAELVPEHGFVWTAVTQDMLRRHGVSIDEVEGLIDILRRAEEAEVACVLKEEADGTVRVSLRSLGSVAVDGIAVAHGGGGHRFASGFSAEGDVRDVVARILAAL
jgi:phosphoesterase RecJ-like protein